MARVLVTGSADGLGRMVGAEVARRGHQVVLHARDEERAHAALAHVPEAAGVIVGDVSSMAGARDVAEQANDLGRYDAVVHNVGVGFNHPDTVTVDGLNQLWAVNVLAPYLLTALIPRPQRLVYLSSGMHLGGSPRLVDVQWSARPWDSVQAYSDSKLHDVLLAFGLARRWPDVPVNVVSPGWVPTRMGGAGAPDDLQQAHLTQVELAIGDSPMAHRTGGFLYHQAPGEVHRAGDDIELQDALIAYCAQVSNIHVPD